MRWINKALIARVEEHTTELAQVNRMLGILISCRRAMTRVDDEQALLDVICRILCDEAGYRFCWVGYAEGVESKSIRPLAWSGVENVCHVDHNSTWDESELVMGPAGAAIRRGETVYIPDFVSDSVFSPWLKHAFRCGCCSGISLPLRDPVGMTFGVLNIYCSGIYALSSDEVRLLNELAKDLAFGISALRTRSEPTKLEKRITTQEQSLADNFPKNIICYDRECRAVYVKQTLKSLPFPEELILGKTPLERHFSCDQVIAYSEVVNYEDTLKLAMNTDAAGVATFHVPLSSGELGTHSLLITPERDENGNITGVLVSGRDITEQQDAERQLRELHKRLDTIFATIPDLVWLKNVDGVYLACNQQFERFFGALEADIVGKTDFDFVNAELAQFFRDNDVEAIRAGGVRKNEEWITFADSGKSVCLETRKTPVFDQENKIIGVLGIGRDITERKRYEEALREIERRYRMLADNVNDIVWVIDISGRLTYVSPSVERLTGFSADEMLARTIDEILTPMSATFAREKLTVAVGRILAGLRPNQERLELEEFRKDGSVMDIEVIVSAMYDSDGKFAGFLGVSRDITERKRAEKMMRETNERFGSMLRAASAYSIMVTDTDGIIKIFNEGAEQILGYRAEEVVDRTTPELFHDQGEIAARAAEIGINPGYEALVVAARKGETETREWTYVRKDGSRIIVSLSVTAMVSENGTHTGFICIARDITVEKKLEQHLHQSQKMEAIGQLAGGIAHDFNNIMTAIVSFTHVLGMKLGHDSPFNSYLDKILAAADRATALTRDLLTFSRKQGMELKPIDLGKAMAEFQCLIDCVLREDIELIVSSPDAAYTIMAAENHITQILMNLTVNARDAMPSGGQIVISISDITMDRNFVDSYGFGEVGKYALITFADTGCGMDEKTQERIFEPFFTTKEVGKGTGLGLATVYGIVRRLRGFINVYSDLGKGTSFRIYLPLIDCVEKIEEVS